MSWLCVVGYVFFFFFKQKTAYEMRISDWSSDVCSSDLKGDQAVKFRLPRRGDRAGAADDPQQREDRFYQRFRQRPATVAEAKEGKEADEQRRRDKQPQLHLQAAGPEQTEIGRAHV